MQPTIRIGTAGWSISSVYAERFPALGSQLTRYATGLNAVEINSSFYQSHKQSTYERWAASVPADFRFAVKLPREITHLRQLDKITEPLARFLAEIRMLGDTLGPVLMQLPPNLSYDSTTAAGFFQNFRARSDINLVCEPRHSSWFTDDVDQMLADYRVARVAADPATAPGAATPGGWPGIVYRRLHGSPKMYYSTYPDDALERIARLMQGESESWCIFDNTAMGAALGNALTQRDLTL